MRVGSSSILFPGICFLMDFYVDYLFFFEVALFLYTVSSAVTSFVGLVPFACSYTFYGALKLSFFLSPNAAAHDPF